MEKVAIYTRISSDRHKGQEGVTRQEALCRDLSEKRELQVVAVEQDNDTSAFKQKNRPGWNRLLKLIKSGEISGVVVWHSDRLYRRVSDLGLLVDLVKKQNLKIYSVVAGDMDLSSASGILQAELLASVAGYEIRHKSERQVARARELAHSGLWNGGRVPLGYRLHPHLKHMLEVDQAEAEMLRHARGMLFAGHGMKATARWVRDQLISSGSTRKSMTATSLRNTLLSPTIAGKRVYVPQSAREAWAERRATGQSRAGDYEIGIEHTLPGKWEPIFSAEEWRSLVVFLTKPERTNPGRAPKSMLSGVLVCGLCGSKMGYSSYPARSDRSTPKPSYKCSDDTLNCAGVGVSAAPVEEYMTGIVQVTLNHSPFLVGLPDIKPLSAFTERDRRLALRREFLDLFETGQISRAELDERLETVNAALTEMDIEEGNALQEREELAVLNNSITRWEHLEVAERRAVFRRVFVAVTILPAGREWGRAFQRLRVVPWWVGGPEPDMDLALARLQAASSEQRASVERRKELAEARRETRLNRRGIRGGLK